MNNFSHTFTIFNNVKKKESTSNSMHSLTRHFMEMNGELHASATFPLRKELLVPIGQKTGWVPEPIWMPKRRVKCLTPAWISTTDPQSSSQKPNHYTD
jgi:hypothetical protein